MPLLRSGFAVVLFLVSAAVVGHGQDEKPFPTDNEVNLLLTQADRAIQLYKPLIDQEEVQLGKAYAEAVAKDRQVVRALEMALKALKAQPQGFNGPAGFAFFEWLDDADRNALLCASGASTQSTLDVIAGNTDRANSLIHLSQSCMDASALIYTVSENAGSLYQRYVEAEEQLARKGLEVAQKCAEALKKMAATKK